MFKFLSRNFGIVGNTKIFYNTKILRILVLIREIRLTPKFMTSQPGLQAIAMHILPNISQSKGNQTMKFGHLIEYNKRNIFFSKIMWKMRQGD